MSGSGATQPNDNFGFGPIRPWHEIGHFNCGERQSNEWLKVSRLHLRTFPRHYLEVLFEGPLVLGYVSMSVRRRGRVPWVYMLDMGVDLESQRLGYAELMLTFVDARARERQYADGVIGLECNGRTPAIQPVLLSAGFQRHEAGGRQRFLRRSIPPLD